MIFRKIPALKYKEVVKGLEKLGFSKRKNKATSHEQWVCDAPFRKVTVDKHESPFSRFLVQAMAKQAGVPVKEFCRLCKDKNYKLTSEPAPEIE